MVDETKEEPLKIVALDKMGVLLTTAFGLVAALAWNAAITTEVEQLLSGKNFASFATLMKDGSSHVAPTWIDYDGELVLINTAAGRIEEKNVNSDKRVALSVYDNSNPYNMVTIRGR